MMEVKFWCPDYSEDEITIGNIDIDQLNAFIEFLKSSNVPDFTKGEYDCTYSAHDFMINDGHPYVRVVLDKI
jgi:hypothetical protein